MDPKKLRSDTNSSDGIENVEVEACTNTQGNASPEYTVEGVQSVLRVFSNKITITPKGVLGFLNHGIKGTKTIPFSSITAMQHKRRGAIVSGYLQFSIKGGNESKTGVFAATQDENTFMYNKADQIPIIEKIIQYIEQAKDKPTEQVSVDAPVNSIADELTKLASLRDQGILTNEEFQAAKNRLLQI